MKYELVKFTIREIYKLIDEGKIDLNPSYQRNFIWSTNNQSELIDTILNRFPLPNFFLYRKSNGTYEMVDGQQRSKTIYKFIKGEITSSKETGKLLFQQVDSKEGILDYWIPIVLITEVKNIETLRNFYVLINKKGMHLNTPELYKSEYHETNFLKLTQELSNYQPLISLNIFTDASRRRMNDRAFIEELVAYLREGIREKKVGVKIAYDEDVTDEEYDDLLNSFKKIIDKISLLDKIQPISKTRYKQKNDFYTLFNFIAENFDEDDDILRVQYRILLLLDGKDSEGRQFIRPSNEECDSLKNYANNCVTQSNSKNARYNRLRFFNSILKNTYQEGNDALNDVLDYFSEVINKEFSLEEVGQYFLISI